MLLNARGKIVSQGRLASRFSYTLKMPTAVVVLSGQAGNTLQRLATEKVIPCCARPAIINRGCRRCKRSVPRMALQEFITCEYSLSSLTGFWEDLDAPKVHWKSEEFMVNQYAQWFEKLGPCEAILTASELYQKVYTFATTLKPAKRYWLS